jgi:simple sugar transport system permease protein
MAIAGLLAGVAGAIQVMGVSHNINVLAAQEGYGFDGIAVALIANSNPIGVIFSGLLFGAFKYGGTKMQTIEAPSEVINIVIGSIVYFIALSSVLRGLYIKMRDKKNKGGNI